MAGRWRRPRTKVYDCNFNRAESYYKGVMDSLDRKHGNTSLDPVSPLDERDGTPSSRVSRLMDRDRESPAASTSSRASRLLAELENGVESSHKQSRASLLKDDDDIDAEFEATMKKIKASRAARNAELEEEFDSISSRKNKISLGDQLLDSVGINSKTQRSIEEDVFSKHKRAAKKFFDEEDDKAMTKWTVINPAAKAIKDAEEVAEESSASARARKSRARLQDIDAELEELDRKSAARQKRISDLKALVAENNSDTQSSASSSVKVTKRITTVKQTAEKKQVSF